MNDVRKSLSDITCDFELCVGNDRIFDFELKAKGGSALVYLASFNGREGCIVKEYYPNTDEYNYVRNDKGELEIMPKNGLISEKELNDIKSKALDYTDKLIKREINMVRTLYAPNGRDNNNHVFSINGEPVQKGDTYYVVFRTTEGQTLYDKVLNSHGGRLTLERAINDTLQLLEIITDLFESRKIHHGDVKPDNIWCGNAPGMSDYIENKYILDYASAISYETCKVENIEELSRKEIIEKAKDILADPGIGFSSAGYRSKQIKQLEEGLQSFAVDKTSLKKAKDLIIAINKLDIRTDIYSVIHMFRFMLLGKAYKRSEEYFLEEDFEREHLYNAEYLVKEINVDIVVAKKIIDIFRKNENEEYTTVAQVISDFNTLLAIYKKDAIVEVMLEAIREDVESNKDAFNKDVDKQLFCDIDEI